MGRIVDLRHERIAAACVQLVENGERPAPWQPPVVTPSESAEIILFPLVSRKWLKRPRKRLTRRLELKKAPV
ncbi:MAG: hypothetical protein ACFCUR_05365 [Rhodomicrobiaceae bacterium]